MRAATRRDRIMGGMLLILATLPLVALAIGFTASFYF